MKVLVYLKDGTAPTFDLGRVPSEIRYDSSFLDYMLTILMQKGVNPYAIQAIQEISTHRIID